MGLFSRHFQTAGLPPGVLVQHEDEFPRPPLRLTLVDYGKDGVTERFDVSADECRAFLQTPTITWVHVQGGFEADILRDLGNTFDLHSLALEDVINSGHRPKAEIYEEQLFVVLTRPAWQTEKLVFEQVSLFYARDVVISFYDGSDEDPFEPVRKRLRQHNGWLRDHAADYLFYDLIDVVIDAGFPLLEVLDERIEVMEDELLDKPDQETLGRLHVLKRDLLALRRMLWPHREVINFLMREDFPLIEAGTRLYFRDCYDHVVHIIELLEAYRDLSAGMLDIYLSSSSQRLNENMRLLTVISTIFMPLTFITSVYGMNFDPHAGPWNMPELGLPYGYLLVWTIMLSVASAMLLWFRRRRLL